MKRVAIIGSLIATSSACLLGIGIAVAGEVVIVHVPARIETAPIVFPPLPKSESATKGHSFRFSVDTSPCLGFGPTVFHEVKVVERPKTKARPYKSSVIYAVVEHQAWDKYVEKVGTEYQSYCTANGSQISKRIKLKRPAADLIFFDGSSSPPRRIYPPSRRAR